MFIVNHVVAAMLLIMVKLNNTFLQELQGISYLTGKHLKNVKESVVSLHLLQCDYTIDVDNFDILASDTNSFRLLIKESLLLKRDKPDFP